MKIFKYKKKSFQNKIIENKNVKNKIKNFKNN